MARVVLILMVASVLMFAFVLTTQPQLIRNAVVSYEDFVRNTPLGTAEEKSEPKSEPAPVRSKPAPRKVAPKAQAAQVDLAEVPVLPVAMEPARLSPMVVSVARDEVVLYSFNSSDGPIVTVLQKGAVVEPQLEINDGGRRWSYVNVADRPVSGFLQSENLERKRGQ